MGWGTAQKFYSYNRKVQAYAAASITSSNDTQATITMTAQMRSGDGSGYYYAAEWGATVQSWYKVGSGSWANPRNVSVTLNYGDVLPSGSDKNTSFTVTKTHAAQTVTCQTECPSSDWPTAKATVTVTVPAKTSYTVSYNANNGSGAPASQTKWYGESLTLSSTVPTRTGYTFLGWSTSSTATTATYSAGGSYTNNAGAALYAVWKANTYTVTYNANGGSSTPASQTRTYGGGAITIANGPSRALYSFTGWNTSQNGTGTSYSAGASYSGNASMTLYAQWKLAYVYPTISSLTIRRCSSATAGSYSDNGTYAEVKAVWSVDRTAYTSNTAKKFTISYSKSGGSETTVNDTSVSGSTSGTFTKMISGFDTDYSYNFTVTLYDNYRISSGNYGSVTKTGVLTPTFYTIDLLAGGKGIAIGKAATDSGYVDIASSMSLRAIDRDIYVQELSIDRDGSLPSSSQWSNGFTIRDKDNETLGYIQAARQTDGRVGIGLVVQNEGTGATTNNNFFVWYSQTGERTYSVADQAAFRKAINAAGCSNQTSMDANVGNFLGADQIWGLTATSINSNNTTYNGKRVTLILKDNGLWAYNNTSGTGIWSLENMNPHVLVNNNTETIKVHGRVVMVQVHGRTGAPGQSGNFIPTSLSSYKPGYNVSALVADASAANHVARVWVDTSGNIKIASVGYTTNTAWYGTLTYIY